MTIPIKSQLVTKLDRRYKYFDRGFCYRINLRTRGIIEWGQYRRVAIWLHDTLGPAIQAYGYRADWREQTNEHYIVYSPKNSEYRQFYLKSESDLTMLLLIIS